MHTPYIHNTEYGGHGGHLQVKYVRSVCILDFPRFSIAWPSFGNGERERDIYIYILYIILSTGVTTTPGLG